MDPVTKTTGDLDPVEVTPNRGTMKNLILKSVLLLIILNILIQKKSTYKDYLDVHLIMYDPDPNISKGWDLDPSLIHADP